MARKREGASLLFEDDRQQWTIRDYDPVTGKRVKIRLDRKRVGSRAQAEKELALHVIERERVADRRAREAAVTDPDPEDEANKDPRLIPIASVLAFYLHRQKEGSSNATLAAIHVEHLLVSFAGAVNAPAGVTRTHDEAKARAEEALTKVGATDAEWAAAVRTYSDAPLKEDAGDIGWMTPGQMADVLDKAAFTLQPGAVSAVVETPVGFHVMRRVE